MDIPKGKDDHDEIVDPDFSLDEFFKDDSNAESNTESSSGVKQNQIAKDNLDVYFEEEWPCNSTSVNQPSTTVANVHSTMSSRKTKLTSDACTKQTEPSTSAKSVFEIIRFGTTSAFTKLLKSNFKLDVLNDKGQTALHLLFNWRSWDYFDLLDHKLSHGPKTSNNIDFTDQEGLTHLMVACARGSLSLFEKYLRNNDNVNAVFNGGNDCSGFTPLHFALVNLKIHKKEMVEKLIQRGANVNAMDCKGRTPFHIASRVLDKQDIVESNKEIGVEIIDVLLENGSDVNKKDADGNTPLLSVFSLHYQEFKMDFSFEDPSFHVSVHMPEIKRKLKFFLKRGADVIATNNKNENVLHLILVNLKWYRYLMQNANYKFDDSDHLDMIKQILVSNPKFDINFKNDEGEAPLQLAVACMRPRIVELLLDHGADSSDLTFKRPKSRDSFFCYPDMVLIYEAVQDLIDVLEILSNRGFDLSLENNITVLSSLEHEGENCDCSIGPDTNIKFLLYYGIDSHVESVLDTKYMQMDVYEGPAEPDDPYVDGYNDESLGGSEKLYVDVKEYLDTTRFASIYSKEDVLQKITEIIEHHLRSRFEPCTFDYVKYMEKDLNQLKDIKFDNGLSLHDVLMKDPRDTPRLIMNNFDLKSIENLHCYKEAVKGHITKARIRFLFEKYTSDYLKIICDSLPDVFCRMIVYYLDNDDIFNLCLATTIDLIY